jgi:hypothetical protein
LDAFFVAEAHWNIAHALSPTASEKEHREFRETFYAELGRGAAYQPWLQVKDVMSAGQSHKTPYILTPQ